MSIIYGLEITSPEDDYLKISEEGVAGLVVAGIPGAFLVDTFPWLKYVPSWMPGAGFQKKAQAWYRCARRMIEDPYNATKQNMVSYVLALCHYMVMAYNRREQGEWRITALLCIHESGDLGREASLRRIWRAGCSGYRRNYVCR